MSTSHTDITSATPISNIRIHVHCAAPLWLTAGTKADTVVAVAISARIIFIVNRKKRFQEISVYIRQGVARTRWWCMHASSQNNKRLKLWIARVVADRWRAQKSSKMDDVFDLILSYRYPFRLNELGICANVDRLRLPVDICSFKMVNKLPFWEKV
jgi:hypothetical protein